MRLSNHYKHVDIHSYETTHRAMLQASTDELTARGYSKVLEEDEFSLSCRYVEKNERNYSK